MGALEKLLRAVVNPSAGASVLVLAIIAFYGVGTWFADVPMSAHTHADMIFLPWVSALGVAIGSMLFRHRAPLLFLDDRAQIVVYATTVLFVVFCIVTIASARSVPLLDALRGQTPAQIAVARELFLKARQGWGAILPYANALLTGALLPYCMCIAILRRYRFRWLIVALFFLYSLLFVEKAFFLRIFLPLMAVVVVSQNRKVRLTWLLAVAVALLVSNIVISGFGTSSGMGAGDYLLMRTFVIPIRTVTDSLNYWWHAYHGIPFHGATNLIFSHLFGLARVQFEREVFVYEWGPSITGTQSANAAFFVESYVNFGWPGVFLVSFTVGALISYIGRSSDQAFRCILPLVLFSLFVGGAFGLLFGNGLLLCLVVSAAINRRSLCVPSMFSGPEGNPLPSPYPSSMPVAMRDSTPSAPA